MTTSVLETSFVEQSGYAKTAQFIYDLLTAKGLTIDKKIEFDISRDCITISIIDECENDEVQFIILHTQIEIEIHQVRVCPMEIVRIQEILKIRELAQEFANYIEFD